MTTIAAAYAGRIGRISEPAETFGLRRCVSEAPRRFEVRPAKAPRKRPVAESVLHSAWQAARTVIDRSGASYRIIFAGIPGGSAGPDFRDVVIERPDGRIVRGDVEIHVRRSGWFRHGHHRDPVYNGVVFHVTLDDGSQRHDYSADGDGAVMSAAGISVPLLLLKGPASAPSGRPAGGPIGLHQISLEEAGDRRFYAWSSGLSLDLRSISADELIWRAVMECLGYAANRRPFRALAGRMPWRTLATLGPEAPLDYVERALLWAGGFAEKPPVLGRPLPALTRPKPKWAARYGRPDNRPERRIAGAAVLAHRWLGAGGPEAAMSELIGSAGQALDVVEALAIAANPAQSPCTRALIGSGRAAEISVNAVLPAVHAIAGREGRWHLYEKSLSLFQSHPKTPENAVTREMRRLFKERDQAAMVKKISTAREQQGLIYLYRKMTRPATA